MNTFVAFLKGVNIGGHKAIKMDELKKILLTLGFAHVKTYINSGNIVFCSHEDKEAVREQMEKAIFLHFGISVAAVVKTAGELLKVVAENPFDHDTESDSSKRAVVFLSRPVASDQADVFSGDNRVTERIVIREDVLFAYYPRGFSKTKFTGDYIERRLRLTATARNWNTVCKLAEIVNSFENENSGKSKNLPDES